MSSASIQKLFCGIYSTFKCSFDEFVGEKLFSPSYSSAILAPPSWSDSLQPHGLLHARLLCPWDFLIKNTRVGSHFLPQGIFPTQGSSLCFLHCRQTLYHLLCHLENPRELVISGISSSGEFWAVVTCPGQLFWG